MGTKKGLYDLSTLGAVSFLPPQVLVNHRGHKKILVDLGGEEQRRNNI